MTETALSTALNVSYMADRLALFSVVVGVALLLAGVGFVVLDYAALHRRRKEAGAEIEVSAVKPGRAAVA